MKDLDPEKLEQGIKRCDNIRVWMIVLASVLLLVGYMSGNRLIFVGCVLPLLAAAGLTYRMKDLQKKLDRIGLDPETEETKHD